MRALYLGILSVGVAALSGCGGSGTSRQFISIGTAPVGGVFYTIGGAIGEVLNQNVEEATWQVTAESTGGSQENISLLGAGDIQFAVCNSSISYFASRGEGDWDAAQDIRVVMTMFPNVAMFVTKKDGDIQSIADLTSKRVTLGPPGAGFEYFISPILQAHGVQWDDLDQVFAGQQTSVDYLADGSVAAAFLGGGVPTGSITSAAASMDIMLVPYEDEAKTALTEQYPFFDLATIPADTYKGQSEAYEGLNVGSAHLVSHANVSEDLVYEITKAIYENRETLVEKHKAARSIQPGNVVRNTGVPFHSGAIRYYQEIGIWPESAE